ncbi:hypothetical protein D3C86_343450 [compost metagenome]
MSKLPFLVALTAAFSLSGCATLIGGGNSQIDVAVEEPRQDLEVRIIGLSNGETITRRASNFSVSLNRNSDYKIVVHSPSYVTEEVLVRRNVRPHFWANFCCTAGVIGFVGLGIDFFTHNMWEHDKNRVDVRLQKERRSTTGQYSVLPILLTNDHGHERMLLEAPILR